MEVTFGASNFVPRDASLKKSPRRTEIPSGDMVFFDNWRGLSPLPSALEIRSRIQSNDIIEVLRNQTKMETHEVGFRFVDLNLVVKSGVTVTIAEGQALWLMRHYTDVRVPEVYGWIVDSGQTFIYMEYIEGVTVSSRWPSLTASEKSIVVAQLQQMLQSMRRLRQESDDVHIGKS